ncbi:MAG: biosynthetic arginine decarboxylase, partial [Acidobacteriota bacterium]|nr:biosynthetic arginine decarboxylase [Acidobacteriota bacterium]
MNISITDRFRVEDAAELYGLDGWGRRYFAISPEGRLQFQPEGQPDRQIDVCTVVETLRERGFSAPVLLRFPQALGTQVDTLAGAFAAAINEYNYCSTYRPVFPIKVNHQRSVVEGLLRFGQRHSLGLEVGSRSELMLAAALDTPKDSLIICNGFKDAEYLATASIASRLGKRVIVVIEKPFELEPLLALARDGKPIPQLGFRLRLQARGSGMWEKSGGFASKFGLTTAELVDCLGQLKEHGLLDAVRLLHFHIGSQVTEIRKIKAAVEEATRVYSRVCKLGIEVRYLDVGGGLGIDYDGSRTSSDASVNYSVQEYANDVVFGISEVCEQENVPHPIIVSESGRMLAAHHSMLVTDVRGVISGVEQSPPRLAGNEHQIVKDLDEIYREMTVKNFRETYHDGLEYRDQMHSLFRLGMLGLEDRALAERLFFAIAVRAVAHSKTAKFVADEFLELETKLQDKYICNFSVFQS